jgi:hypothetical protein
MGSVRDISNSQLGQVACSQLAIDRQIEEREIPDPRSKFQPDADAPDVSQAQWRLLTD